MKLKSPSLVPLIFVLTEGFIVTNNYRHSSSTSTSCEQFRPTKLALSNHQDDYQKKQVKTSQNSKQKKRRFAQEVEPVVASIQDVPKRRLKSDPSNNDNSNDYKKGNMDAGGRLKNKRSNQKNKNPMLQNTKSIEDLESVMSKRWGTGLDEWTVDFDKWEVADDDDDNNNDNSQQGSKTRESIKSGNKVRSRAVLNPWDKEERQKLFDSKKQNKKSRLRDENELKTNASAFQSAKSRNDAVMDRVRRNQERLQDKNGGEKERDSNYDDETELEFYDEDDEGFEFPQVSSDPYNGEDKDLEEEANKFFDNIISPQPIGGSGSSRNQSSSKQPNNRDDDKKSSTREGFFFNEAAALSSDEKHLDEQSEMQQSQKKKQQPKKAIRRQIMDSEGNEILLTLEYAERNAESYAKDKNDNNDGSSNSNANESSWEDIGITHPMLLNNLKLMNCHQPLSVQDKACPSIVSGNDVLISTHTGSGKTLAFLAPLAQRILFDMESHDGDGKLGVRVIIIAPGRELASQIVAVGRELFQGTDLSAMLAIGGTPFSRNYEQIRKKKPTFLIGTPGRLAELVVGKPGEKSGKLKISSLHSVVLDECDALLEYKPHEEPTAAIMNVLQRRHRNVLQSILCSATAGDLQASSKLDGYLCESYAHAQSDKNDETITEASNSEFSQTRVSRTAVHGVVHVEHKRFALETLRKVLYTEPAPQQVLIFVDNSRRVGIVVDKLAQMGIIAAPLHGGQGSEKGDRAEVNKALREGFVGVVVATEMAARGIDAPYLTHVINLDLPTDASHYAHRAGRCGRGGRPGVVVNLAVGGKERGVPLKFAKALNIDMYDVEPQAGKLAIVEPLKKSQTDIVK